MIEDVALSIVRGALILGSAVVVLLWLLWICISLAMGDREDVWLWGRHPRIALVLFWPPVVVVVLVILWGIGEAGRYG